MTHPEVECPHCETVYDAREVDQTIWNGEPAWWCLSDTCPDTPMSLNDHLLGSFEASLEEQ